jgi:EmrB/QacA subfamily drug resistance transporter
MSHRRQVLVIASAASFLVYLDVTVVNIAFPDIEADFASTTRGTLAWILAAYNITFAALLVPGGRISDRFGRKRLFGIGIVVFALASAGCAAAGDAGVLIAFRVLQAIGGAMLVPASQGLVLEAFPREERTKAISLWVAAGAVAVALGPPLGGVLVELASWHWVFLINLPIAAGVLLAGWGRLHESRDESTTALPDPVGVALSAAAVGALVLAIVQGDGWGWTSAATLASFAAFAVLTPLFVLRTRRALVPALDLGLFSSRAFSLANLASLLMGIGFYGLIFATVLFMTTVWGYTAIEAGLALTPAPLVAAISAGLGGRTAEGASLIRRASAGILLFVAGTAWFMATLEAEPDYLGAMLPGTVLLGAGAGLAVSLLSSAALQAIPAATFAAGGAVNSATRQVGAALGVAAIVAVVGTPAAADAVAAFDDGWLTLGLTALAALPVTLAIGAGALTVADQPGRSSRNPRAPG